MGVGVYWCFYIGNCRKERDAVLKVGKQRTTLVIEASNSDKGPWKELAFHHIPTDTTKMPSCIGKSVENLH